MSWTSEPSPGPTSGPTSGLTSGPTSTSGLTSGRGLRPALPLLVVLVVAAIGAAVAQQELAVLVIREQLTYDALRIGFVLVGLIGFVGLALMLLAAPATGVAGASTAVALVAAYTGLAYRHLRHPETIGPHDLFWVTAFALTPLVMDAAVGWHHGRRLPLAPVLGAAVAVAVLEALLSHAQQIDYVGISGDPLRDPAFWVTSVAVGPALLLAGAGLGWLLGRLPVRHLVRGRPRAAPAAGSSGRTPSTPPSAPPSPPGPRRARAAGRSRWSRR